MGEWQPVQRESGISGWKEILRESGVGGWKSLFLEIVGYTYYKKGAVNATTAGAQTLYPLGLIVGESSGAIGADVHCENHCLDFPNDIRFTKEDGITKHDYWIEEITGTTPNRKAVVLIEVASIPASGSVEFYMYYRKASDLGESNGNNTFEFFDDFSGSEITNPWTRYGSNPILVKNPTNPSWDYYFVNSPFIAVNTDGTPYKDANNRYYMYYSGSGNADGYVFNEDQVGLARSTDLYAWTRVTSTVPPLGAAHDGLVLPLGPNGTFDDSDAQIGTIIVKDDTFHMWYTGNDQSGADNLKFGYATSPDGVTWTKHAANPILSYGPVDDNDGVYAPHVILDGNTWKMWYTGKNTVGSPTCGVMYATAPLAEPWNWTRYSNNYVYEYDTNPGNSMWGSYVWKDGSTYYMIFVNYTSQPFEFRYATSNDGVSWTYQGRIFGVGEVGQWDEKFLVWISQIQVGGIWYSYYRANDNSDNIAIGVATGSVRVPTPGSSVVDSAKWDEVVVGGSGALTVESGKLDAYSGSVSGRAYVKSKTTFGDCAMKARAIVDATGNGYGEIGLGSWYLAEADDYIILLDGSTTNINWYLRGRKAAGAHGAATLVTGDGSYHNFEIRRLTSEIQWYIDNVLKKTESDSAYIPTVGLPLEFGSKYASGPEHSYLDWVYVRKYTSPEPTWGAWGGEQS